MSRKSLLALPAFLALLSGCTLSTTLYRIPDTPDAMAAYRQCMTITHPPLLAPCLKGIPGIVGSGKLESGDDQKLADAWLAEGTGCRILADYYLDNDRYVIQTCTDTKSGMAGTEVPPPNSFKDADGNWHLRK